MKLLRDLKSSFPKLQASASAPDRLAYARDSWPRRLLEVRAGQPHLHQPAAIVWPSTSNEVSELVQWAGARGVPVVPFGAGSGVCGGILPSDETLVIDLKRLNGFTIDDAGETVDVGAGMLGVDLEHQLDSLGHTAGHFPSSILCSTVGGWVATRSAGQCSGKYGKIEDMLFGAEAVFGTGELVQLEPRRRGINMLPLITGSEGTLAIVTRARLRLHRAPQVRSFFASEVGSFEQGLAALRQIYQEGWRPPVARLYDPFDSWMLGRSKSDAEDHETRRAAPAPLERALRVALRAPRAINAATARLGGGHCTLVLVFEGDPEENEAGVSAARHICHAEGGRDLGEGPARAWFAHRYSISYRQSPVFTSGAFSDTMEIAAPWSDLPTIYRCVRRALSDKALVMAHASHSYPQGGCIYFTFAASGKSDAQSLALYDRIWHDALAAATEAGATLSHHHGVGRSKAPQLPRELGRGLEVLKRLQHAWDPKGILNPGALSAGPGESREDLREELPPLQVDPSSLLVDADASLSMAELTRRLSSTGLELDLEDGVCPPPELALVDWVALGAPGARDQWCEPLARAVFGLEAVTHSNIRFAVKATPRHAAGPDLSHLFLGADGQIGTLERVVLALRRSGSKRASMPLRLPESPQLSSAEQQLWQRAVKALTTPR